jgi:fructokinase
MIVVCGEALMDMIRNGDGTQRAAPGGGPFNTARALARLGVPTAFLGHLSNDKFGRELSELLVADGVSLQLLTVGSEPTTTAIADVDSEGFAEYRFVVEGTSAGNLTPELVPADLGRAVEALYVGSLGLVLQPMASTLVDLVRRERYARMVILDPNVRLGLGDEAEYCERIRAVISSSTVVKASDSDLAWLYPDVDHRAAAEQILAEGVRLVVITLGKGGAFGAHRDHRIQVAAPQVEVVDTIGAGDAFGAALLAWLYDHDLIGPRLSLDASQLSAALDYASLAASITCGRAGADPPWKREMAPA